VTSPPATSGAAEAGTVPDAFTLLTTLQREAENARIAAERDVMSTVGLSPRGSRDQLAKALLDATGTRRLRWQYCGRLHGHRNRSKRADPAGGVSALYTVTVA